MKCVDKERSKDNFCTHNLNESLAIAFKRKNGFQEGSKTTVINWNERIKIEIIPLNVKVNIKELHIFKGGRSGHFHPRIPEKQQIDSKVLKYTFEMEVVLACFKNSTYIECFYF